MSINKFKNMLKNILPGSLDGSSEAKENAESGNTQNSSPTSLMTVEEILDCTDLSVLTTHLTNNDRHKRHAALVGIGQMGTTQSIPDFFDCLDDDAPEIRAAARKFLLALATTKNTQIFVDQLPQLYELKLSQKNNHSEFISSIEQYLIEPQNVLNVRDSVSSSDKAISHACFALMVKYKLGEGATFIKSALQHPDQSIRIKAAEMIKQLEAPEKQEALEIAIQDRYMPIRRDAYLTMMQNWSNAPMIKKMLFDQHFAIREIAVAHLKKLNEDVEHTYLRSLSDNDPLIICAALWGLGFLKVAECKTLVEPFLQHDHPRVKEQAQLTLDALKEAPKKFTDTVEWNSTDTHF